ncbi:HD domain-containing protein [Virgibacillus dakarensis]|uniref:bis(5'-nucleosyl)-tetraphosphatase (symmetrical) n=1 Tax=Lentibacillus populi TaxID=1827502 RepID=A0A9W5X3U4_9BACI|nr:MULTISPECIES: bis(5'-nucleosyl)-tetraphosphatase (symmetrical) YqeK [Bacillaceae]MBT2215082.1 bis(5'-nucleosyl)-tetraphosphatase (symmetrical) YqeK [Virgibacillus dakarensis]MTW84135.1 HD domain-containing protein [Virgibacillus dakarensis]GGB28861.1 HD domain-containing protein [Lentibacillus populi]
MNRNEWIAAVKPHLTEQRFEHTLRVARTAVQLAKRFHVSEEKAELAAIFHDYAKFRSLDEMRQLILSSSLPNDLLLYHHELWHAPVGAILVRQEQAIHDTQVLGAIHYHTTGKAHMNKLEMIVLLADYIEPGRSFPGLEEVREAAQDDLIRSCWLTLRNTIQFLMGKGSRIYPDTFHAYNDLTKQINGGY